MQRTLLVLLGLGLSTVASAHTTRICTTDNMDGTTDVHVGTYSHGSSPSATTTVWVDGVAYGPVSGWTTAASVYPGSDDCVSSSYTVGVSQWTTVTVPVTYGTHTVRTNDTGSARFLWHAMWWGGSSTASMTFGFSDSDGDGIADHEDDCPTEDPDTYYGYDVAEDGCISDLIGTGCPTARANKDDDTDFNNMADQWGILARGDATLSGASQGSLRVFGDGDLYSFNVGTDPISGYSYAGLGDLYARSGSFAEDVRAASVDVNSTVSTSGATTETGLSGHISTFMNQLSNDMGDHNINGDTTVQSWGTIDFVGTHSMMNTFEVSAADFSASTYMTINVPSGSTAVVNVTGTSADFGPTGVSLTGVDAGGVVYNFPDATSLTIDGASIKGQVVAPKADIDLVSGDVTGTITGNTLDGTLTQYNHSFDGRACAVVAAKAAPSCTVSHTVTNSWPGGYNASITITNGGSAGSSWDLGWDFTGGESVSSGWGGTYSQTSTSVDVSNASYNGVIGAGGSLTIGYSGSGTPAALSGLTATCK